MKKIYLASILVVVILALLWWWSLIQVTPIGYSKQVVQPLGQLGFFLERYSEEHGQYPSSIDKLMDDVKTDFVFVNPYTNAPADVLNANDPPVQGGLVYIPWFCTNCEKVAGVDLVVYCFPQYTMSENNLGVLNFHGKVRENFPFDHVGFGRCWRQLPRIEDCTCDETLVLFNSSEDE